MLSVKFKKGSKNKPRKTFSLTAVQWTKNIKAKISEESLETKAFVSWTYNSYTSSVFYLHLTSKFALKSEKRFFNVPVNELLHVSYL